MAGNWYLNIGCGCNTIVSPQGTAYEEFTDPKTGHNIGASIGFEFFATGLLILCVFAVISSSEKANKLALSAFGALGIGLTVFIAHIFGIPIDGTSINPARTLGAAWSCQMAINEQYANAISWDNIKAANSFTANNITEAGVHFSQANLDSLHVKIWNQFWIFMVMPIVGGIVFAFLYDFVLDDDHVAAVNRFKASDGSKND